MSRKFVINLKPFEFEGNTAVRPAYMFSEYEVKAAIRYAYLYCFDKGHFAPLCSCMSSDGTSVATGYANGQVFINNVNVDPVDPNSSKVTSVLTADNCVKKIEYNPCDSKILVIQSSSICRNSVHILKISSDGLTVTMLHTFQDAMDFQFYDGMFFLQDETCIKIFRLKGDNLPVKMTEFTSKVGHIISFCLTTLNDVVTLWYSTHRDSRLHKAELTLI